MANEYVTAATLKSNLSISDSAFDTHIASCCNAASRSIEQSCNRRFWLDAQATNIRYYTPVSEWLVSIDDLAVLTSLAVDANLDGSFSTTLTNGTDFDLEPLNAVADGIPYTRVCLRGRSGKYLLQEPRYVKVTGKFGWAAVPDQVVEAATLFAQRLFKRQESPLGVQGIGPDGFAVRVPRLDPDLEVLVAPLARLHL